MLTALLQTMLVVGPASTAELPRPLLEFTFDEGFTSDGEVGVAAEPKDYAEGEGPALLPGPWGDCLDLTAASRFGGSLQDMGPAGGALLLSSPRLNSLDAFTVALWAAPAGGQEAINARALTKMGSWELTYSRGSYYFLVVSGDEKAAFRVGTPARGSMWAFVAVTVDARSRIVRARVGDPSGDLGEPLVHELAQPPDGTDGELQIGTFNGIRPFRGKLDNIRIFDRPLTGEQVAALFERDRASQATSPVQAWALPPMPKGRFAPRRSAIFFSSRWQSRRRDETLRLLREYHANWLLWVYGSDPGYIRQIHDIGVSYEGTLNGLCGCDQATPEPSGAGDTTGRQQDFDGNKVVLSHMSKWAPEHPRWTGNHHSAAFRRIFFAEADRLVAAGIDALHIDDWEMTLATARNGLSGFSPESLAGFRAYLQQRLTDEEREKLGIEDLADFDYRAYLKERRGIKSQKQYRAAYRDLPLTPYFIEFHREGLRDFYAALRERLDTVSPDKYISISVNNQFYRRSPEGGLRGEPFVDRFDFLVGEASQSMQSAEQFIMPCKVAEALGIPQVMMCKPHVIGRSQAALATTYALGQWLRVPWDLYMDNGPDGQPAPRYYGTRDDWGRFYDFIHEHSELFDGYVTAAAVGVLFNADEPCYDQLVEVCSRLARAQVPFALIAGAAEHARIPIGRDRLAAARYVVALSPIESFCDEDRTAISAALASRKVRLLSPTDDLLDILAAAGRVPIRVEGPPEVYAFLRVKPGPKPAAVIHVVNWNALPAGAELRDGVGADAFANVTLDLADPSRWGPSPAVEYYRPGREAPVRITPEAHRDMLRITLPRIETWGIVHIAPGPK